jgi:hypothetical protein
MVDEVVAMETENCPKCGASTVQHGFVCGGQSVPAVLFIPWHVRLLRWKQGVPLNDATFHCCVSCGHLWAGLSPEKLRSFVDAYGDELAKQDLEPIDAESSDGLLDSAEGRQASDGVAEIDALIRAGKMGHATRRYRELTQKPWGEANNATLGWRGLTRVQKLALFGWSPKILSKEVTNGGIDHPMRDDLLDG